MSDDNKLYRLVFTGNLLPGHSEKKVIARLQQMLHLDREKASRLVAGKHKQINKKLTLDRAERLRLLILKQGAECVLLPIEESFVSTQQLPMFVRNDDDASRQKKINSVKHNAANDLNADRSNRESISDIRKRSMPLSTSTKLKYLVYALFLMVIEGIVIWNYRPQTPDNSCTNEQISNTTVTQKAASITDTLTKTHLPELETREKIRNIGVRASLWFANQTEVKYPGDVSWIWIQGDIGLSVHDMSDSWGNAIRYFGKDDRFELRSSGPDKTFYTEDDIFKDIQI